MYCASPRRSDLTLVCSPVEQSMLAQHYGVPAAKLALAPFFVPPPEEGLHSGDTSPGFSARRHFMTIGNWRHAPNMDAAKVRAVGVVAAEPSLTIKWGEKLLNLAPGADYQVIGAAPQIRTPR